MRTRVQDRRDPPVDKTTVWAYTFWSGAYSETTSGPYDIRPGVIRSMRDTVTPSFRKLLRNGVDVSNPCSYESTAVETSGGTINVSYTSGDGNPSHCVRASVSGNPFTRLQQVVGSDPTWFLQDCSNMRDHLLVEAMAEAHSPDFSGSLFAAEAVKTMHMLRHPLQALSEFVRKMQSTRSSLLRTGVSLSEATSKTWLEYRYGWRPLMLDVKEATAALMSTQRVPGVVLRSRKSNTLSNTQNISPTMVSSNAYYRWWVETTRELKATVKAGVRYRIADSSYSQFLSTSLGLSLDSVPSTIWELVPYSFVVDWFVDVGSWLRATIPAPHVQVLSNYTSLDVSRICKSIVPFVDKSSPDGGGSWNRFPGAGSYTRSDNWGDRAVNLSVATLPIIIPGRLNLVRQVDSVALGFNQLLRSIKSFRH